MGILIKTSLFLNQQVPLWESTANKRWWAHLVKYNYTHNTRSHQHTHPYAHTQSFLSLKINLIRTSPKEPVGNRTHICTVLLATVEDLRCCRRSQEVTSQPKGGKLETYENKVPSHILSNLTECGVLGEKRREREEEGRRWELESWSLSLSEFPGRRL